MNAFMLFAKKCRMEFTRMYPGRDNRCVCVCSCVRACVCTVYACFGENKHNSIHVEMQLKLRDFIAGADAKWLQGWNISCSSIHNNNYYNYIYTLLFVTQIVQRSYNNNLRNYLLLCYLLHKLCSVRNNNNNDNNLKNYLLLCHCSYSREISVLLGNTWQKMKMEERKMYAVEARLLAEQYKKLNPDCWKRKRAASWVC